MPDQPTSPQPPILTAADAGFDQPPAPSVSEEIPGGFSDAPGLNHRYEVIAFMLASGAPQTKMAYELGYAPATVSRICALPAVKRRAAEVKEQYWGGNLKSRISGAVNKAFDVVEQTMDGKLTVTDDSGQTVTQIAKVTERNQAAQWVLEKADGKAKQEGLIDSGTTVLAVLQAVKELTRAQQNPESASPQAREVLEAAAAKEEDWMDQWVTQHVPGVPNEKKAEE